MSRTTTKRASSARSELRRRATNAITNFHAARAGRLNREALAGHGDSRAGQVKGRGRSTRRTARRDFPHLVSPDGRGRLRAETHLLRLSFGVPGQHQQHRPSLRVPAVSEAKARRDGICLLQRPEAKPPAIRTTVISSTVIPSVPQPRTVPAAVVIRGEAARQQAGPAYFACRCRP